MATSKKDDNYSDELYRSYDYATTEFDKSLTFVSSGILGVSFAFIEKIVPLAKAKNKEDLIYGWNILAIAIFLSIFAHFINTILLRLTIIYGNVKTTQDRLIFWGDLIIQIMNFTTLVLMLTGTFYIILFIKTNL